jgi:hypothetical protein
MNGTGTTARRRANRPAAPTASANTDDFNQTIYDSNDQNNDGRRRMSHDAKFQGQVLRFVKRKETKIARIKQMCTKLGRLRVVDVALFVGIAAKISSFVYYRHSQNVQSDSPTLQSQLFQLDSPTGEMKSLSDKWSHPKWVQRWVERKMPFHSPLLYRREDDDYSFSYHPYLDDDGDVFGEPIKKAKLKGMFLRIEHDNKELLNDHGYAVVDDVVYYADEYSETTQSALAWRDFPFNLPDFAKPIDESHPAFEFRNDEKNHRHHIDDDGLDNYYAFDDDIQRGINGMGLPVHDNKERDIQDEKNHLQHISDDGLENDHAFDDDIQRGTKGMGLHQDWVHDNQERDIQNDDESDYIAGRKSDPSGLNESDLHEQGVCTPPEFYRRYQPTCNEMHAYLSGYHWLIGEEIYSRRWKKRKYLSPENSHLSKYLSHGYYRDAFFFRQSFVSYAEKGTEWDEAVFKTMQHMHRSDDYVSSDDETGDRGLGWDSTDKYTFLHYKEDMRKDAMVMELLSSSPRVIDIYCHCAMSSVTEYAPTNMDAYIMPTEGYTPKSILRGTMRNDELERPLNDHISPEEKLEIALEMAKCVAVLHGFKDGPIVHVDVKVDQFFRGRDGFIKMIDYNRAEALLYDSENEKYCKWTNGEPSDVQVSQLTKDSSCRATYLLCILT